MRPSKETYSSALILAGLYAVTGGIFYLAATRSYEPVEGFASLRTAMLWLLAPLLVKSVLQLLCTPIYSLMRSPDRKGPIDRPSVSVLIPAWNEEVGILKTVRSVLETKYPNLQVIVINDGSTDSTDEIMSNFLSQTTFDDHTSLTYLSLPNGGKATAMNRGLEQAHGEIVVTVDADSVMAPDAIEKLVERFTDRRVGAVAGNVVIANRRKPIEIMQQMEYLYGFFFKRADSVFNSVYIIGGAAAAYRREILIRLGGFDSKIITEDIEMSTRILRHGYQTRYAADAVVYTEGPTSLKGLCDQRLRWKHGRLLTFLKHRTLFFNVSSERHPYLTWLLLPCAVYAELLLLFQILLLGTFFFYTTVTNDYMPLAFVICLLSTIVSAQVIVDPNRKFHRNLILLIPVAWLVFYVVDMVELQALVRSARRMVTGKEIQWQNWVRVGVSDEAELRTAGNA